MKKKLCVLVSIVFGILCVGLCAAYAAPAQALTLRIPNAPGASATQGIESWRNVAGNQGTEGCSLSRGTRKDTVKVTRTIQYLIKGNSNNVRLNIEKRIVLKYEVYTQGPNRGKVYRMYKPTTRVIQKECRYLGIFKLTTRTRSTLVGYGLGLAGDAYGQLEETTAFTLPRQFPFKRDVFTEFLRGLFHIDLKTSQKEYRIVPSGSYGYVSVVSR